jgi:hypothetical protein
MRKNKSIYYHGFWDYQNKIYQALDKEIYGKKPVKIISEYVKHETETDFKKVYDKVIAEINYYSGMGTYAIYTFLLEIFNNDFQMVFDFMTSKYGGYSKWEVNRQNFNFKYFENKKADNLDLISEGVENLYDNC